MLAVRSERQAEIIENLSLFCILSIFCWLRFRYLSYFVFLDSVLLVDFLNCTHSVVAMWAHVNISYISRVCDARVAKHHKLLVLLFLLLEALTQTEYTRKIVYENRILYIHFKTEFHCIWHICRPPPLSPPGSIGYRRKCMNELNLRYFFVLFS